MHTSERDGDQRQWDQRETEMELVKQLRSWMDLRELFADERQMTRRVEDSALILGALGSSRRAKI